MAAIITVPGYFEGDGEQLQDVFGYAPGESLAEALAYLSSVATATGETLTITVAPGETQRD